MMQHLFSAFLVPALPATLSGMLMAVAAFLAGSVLLWTIVRGCLRLVMVSARKRSRTTSEYNEDKAA